MACSDVPRFRAELLRSCAQLGAPECQSGVAQAAEAYGDQCLLLPLYSSVATASVAAYVCPKATGALAVRCEAVAPGLVGPAPHTGDPAPSPGAAGQGPSAGLIAGGSVAGLAALGGALEYWGRRTPYLEQVSNSDDTSQIESNIENTPIGSTVQTRSGDTVYVYTNPGKGDVQKLTLVPEKRLLGGTRVRLVDVDRGSTPGFFRRGLQSTWATRSGSGYGREDALSIAQSKYEQQKL